MRFVAWNMRSGTDRKWAALRALEPDVAVLCEVAREPKALAAPALGEPELQWEWEGANATKGIAVTAWDQPLRRRATRDASGRWSCAAAIGQLLILGIWSCPRSSGQYAAEVERSLDSYDAQIRRHHQVIIAGDFNVAPGTSDFTRLRRRLEDRGFVSAYHLATGDPFGFESSPTFHARHANERSYHIDFVWLSATLADRLAGLTIGPAGPSDHSPIIVDLASGTAHEQRA